MSNLPLALGELRRKRSGHRAYAGMDKGGMSYMHHEDRQAERALREGEQKPVGERSRTIAELGIGTNPQARLQGNLMTDEKVAGTIHVAIGRNDFLGGKNLAPVHIDCVVGEPTLRVDGELVGALGGE